LTPYRTAVNQLQDKICDLEDELAAERSMKGTAKEECTKISAHLDTYTIKQSEEVSKRQTKAQATKKQYVELTKSVSQYTIILHCCK